MSGRSLHAGLGIAAAIAIAFALHGYHFGVADQKLYLPAALQALDPSLYPHDAGFFLTEARFTLYDELVAAGLRVGAPLDVLMFVGQWLATALLAGGARRVLKLAGETDAAAWAGVVLLMMVLPCPVAGTRTGVLEPYLLPRGLAICAALWAFVFAIERRWMAAPLLAVAAALHPLTGLWSAGHVLVQWMSGDRRRLTPTVLPAAVMALLVATAACTGPGAPAVDEATFWQTALSPEVFGQRYPLQWPWYEWAGVAAPIGVLAFVARNAAAPAGARLAMRLAASAGAGVIIAVVLTAAPDRQWPLQPMRQLHLVYVVAFALLGAWTERRVLRGRTWPRVLTAAAVAGAVLGVQQRYPASPHVEWPGRLPDNAYVRAFDWIRTHTPTDSRIAVDPFYLRRSGPDWHAARIFTRRSMLSDAVHDLAPAAMSPPLAARWTAEQRAMAGWRSFTRADFERLARETGISWVVVAAGQAPDLVCPFTEPTVRVCRVP